MAVGGLGSHLISSLRTPDLAFKLCHLPAACYPCFGKSGYKKDCETDDDNNNSNHNDNENNNNNKMVPTRLAKLIEGSKVCSKIG